MFRTIFAGFMALMAAIAGAQDAFRESWNGGSFSYPSGQPEITAWTLTLDGSKPIRTPGNASIARAWKRKGQRVRFDECAF